MGPYGTVVYVGSTPYYYDGGTYYVATAAPAQTPPPQTTQTSTRTTTQTSTTTASSSSGQESLDDIPMTEGEGDENYEVVEAPVGATVPYLSDEAKDTTVDGTKYYVDNDTYYRPFASDGDTIYMVVEDPHKKA